MLSTTEAREIIRENIYALAPAKRLLKQAIGLVLANDVYAPMDIPAYPQSSMDGFAFSFEAWKNYKELLIDGEMAAGTERSINLDPGKAVRIFTGAPVPPGADTVVMQEKSRTEKGMLTIEDEQLLQGANVRLQGSEIRTGKLAMPEGSWLSPAAVGFLAGIGISEVSVFPNPSITIILTGNELQEPGHPLHYGQVYESNSFALTAALQLAGITEIKIVRVRDEPSALETALQQGLQQSDMILITGGVSVGDYDYVPKAASNCGIECLFHKVKQRPGKPLYFGKFNKKPVFGLPGNPSSVLTCFYMYVVPALEIMGQRSFRLGISEARLGKTYEKTSGLTHFLKGVYDGTIATPLPAQESYRMHSFAQANCLIEIEEAVSTCEKGSIVKAHILFKQ